MSNKKILFYATNWCGHCETEYPKVVQIAQKLGYKVEKINVDQCPLNLKEKCDSIEAVPAIEYMGKIMTVSDLEKITNKNNP